MDSRESLNRGISFEELESFKQVATIKGIRKLNTWIFAFFGLMFLILFLPWTQNVDGSGKVTTLRPEHQPHTLNAVVGGRIEKWWVIEGQHVKKGDTLAKLSEVKSDYMDPKIQERIQEQIDAKQSAVRNYESKVHALSMYINSLKQENDQKLIFYSNKVAQYEQKVEVAISDYKAAQQKFMIAQRRVHRADSLFNMNIKSRKDLESAQLKFQEAENKRIATERKLSISQSERTNAQVEYDNLSNTFNAKLSKARSDQLSAQSLLNDAQKEFAMLLNKRSNIRIRQDNYYVLAPQECYVVKTYKKGQGGEIVKEGDKLISLVPIKRELAIELYIKPVDLPLIKIGERMRIIFDGWPSLVISGWPNASSGTFGGEVYAIDKVISESKGKYRVLVIPDQTGNETDWPDALRLGSGARGMFLLNEVPVWYELWRQINGFPPEFYDGKKSHYSIDEDVGKELKTGEEL